MFLKHRPIVNLESIVTPNFFLHKGQGLLCWSQHEDREFGGFDDI